MFLKVWYKSDDIKHIEYKTSGSSGLDLSSSEEQIIPPGYHFLVKTGIHVAIPPGYEGQIRPRSGLALKHGITVLNAPGTVDSDYRGEIGAILINHSNNPYVIHKGDRIAQLVICKVESCDIDTVESKEFLGDTDRKEGGFGSTGV